MRGLPEHRWRAGGAEDAEPERPIGVDGVALGDDRLHRDVDQVAVVDELSSLPKILT